MCRKNGLKRLLMQLAWRDEVASLLLLRLVAGELVLHLGKVMWMREGLLASVRVEMIVDRRGGALVGVEGAWADASSVGCTPAVKLKGTKLSAWVPDLTGSIVFWGVGTETSLTRPLRPP